MAHQANRLSSTLSILDVIAPQRTRFNVIDNPQPIPAKSATMQAIDRAVAKLPPMHTDILKDEPLPGVTEYGRVFNQPLYSAAYLERLATRKGGDL